MRASTAVSKLCAVGALGCLVVVACARKEESAQAGSTPPGERAPSPAAGSLWPAPSESSNAGNLLADSSRVASLPSCRSATPVITSDSIGPLRVGATVAQLRAACPRLFFGWDFAEYWIPAVLVKLGTIIPVIELEDTLPGSRIVSIYSTDASARTASGVGVGSTLAELRAALGADSLSEFLCTLSVQFRSLPGVSFALGEMEPQYQREDCETWRSEELPQGVRVSMVTLLRR